MIMYFFLSFDLLKFTSRTGQGNVTGATDWMKWWLI